LSLVPVLAGASVAAVGLYAAALAARPPRPILAAARAAPVGALAAITLVTGCQAQLVLAFGFSALGAFLLAQVAYTGLFVEDGGGRIALLAEPWRNLGLAVGMAGPAFALARLWPALESPVLEIGACTYAGALAAMVGAAFTLPHRLWPATAGAAGLLAADALKAARLFGPLRGAWSAWPVFALCWAAQALIAWGYLR